ncbi:YfhO family protein [Mucilaginibacter sp. JRF]|uniref:YfhO family protein n=1 Tax=Mucilaginibacter sp. JRF TaxID=2780088 RepID=UPI0018820AC9|nr:YfhO family protein [Mucilaginibacter sp. JRF]MBE9584535.1 YfhO family protein [Mucilaginibacter sp. JRF]
MNNWFKRNGVHLAVIAAFLVISFAYFFSPLVQGKMLYQGDVSQAQAMQREIMTVKEKTGHAPLWTNQMFGGMPSYQIWAPYASNITTHVIDVLKTVFPNPVDTVLLYLLGGYLLFSVLRFKPIMAAAGAVAFAFSSYNFIYIMAGHANQAYAIAFFAPLLAGILLTLRGQYLWGGVITAFFMAMEVRSNHVQMTYYLMLSLVILVAIEAYHAIKSKQTAAFLKSIGTLAASFVLAILINAGTLWTTYEYSHYTIRGKANLTAKADGGETSQGLDKSYAYNWSEGVGEIITFLVPNAYGGGDHTALGDDSKAVKVLTEKGVDAGQAQGFLQQFTYWGDKPGTAGPWYFGAVVCFLFVFGLIVVKNRLKWWIVGATLLSILLSYGKNFIVFSDIFFDYFPLYNKFRAVESILAIASLCFPTLAFLAINEVVTAQDKKPLFNKLKISLYITGGLLLIMAIAPDIFYSFKGANQESIVNNLTQAFNGDTGVANTVASALVQDRISLAKADAIRSLIFVLITFGILWAYINGKFKAGLLAFVFVALVLADMWTVDKRYLKDSNFVDKSDYQNIYKAREVDNIISRDTTYYRVMDLSLGDPFRDSYTSYFHKTVGGFHSARLRRFDELMENQLSKGINSDVLDMLNTKYIITADPKTGQTGMQHNDGACGNAWFVKSVKYADNADQEMQAITSFNPKEEAIVDKQYKSLINEKNLNIDPKAEIKLVSYSPEHLVYESGSTTSQIAVFSEIYYDKGWKMLIDGEETPYFRADYLLRAAQIPVGNHKIEFIFHPTSYYVGENISLAGSVLLVLILGGAIFTEVRKKKVA